MNTQPNTTSDIKHLVISGGGPLMFYGFNILKNLLKNGLLQMDTLQSIHATSSGSILSVLLLVNLDIETISDYIIEFPYNKFFKVSFDNIININKNKGLLNTAILDHYIDSVLKTANIETGITLGDFYAKTHIDLHIYCSELNAFEPIDMNHKAYPDVRLKDALYASCAVPLLFEPVKLDLNGKDCCLVDGAFFCNKPLGLCMQTEYGATFDTLAEDTREKYSNEILCIDYYYKIEVDNILSYIQFMVKKIFKKVAVYDDHKLSEFIKHYYYINLENESLDWVELFGNKEIRREIINEKQFIRKQ